MDQAEKYKFKKYESNFQKLFKLEKQKLLKILGKYVQIEHIGSTAIKGLGGKGIVDIIVACEKSKKPIIKKKLEKSKYLFKEKWGDKNRISFERDYKSKGKIRRVHIHLFSKDSHELKAPLKINKILNKNPNLAREYAKIKKKVSKIAKGKGKVYRKAKKKFLTKLSKMKDD